MNNLHIKMQVKDDAFLKYKLKHLRVGKNLIKVLFSYRMEILHASKKCTEEEHMQNFN